jgi:phage protein D
LAENTLLLSQVYIKIDGTLASEDLMRALVSTTIESSLHLPDSATLVLHDPGAVWIDHADFAPGKTLQIAGKVGKTEHPLFDGEIVELESDFYPGDRRVVVRAFDRLHRLARGRHVRSFLNVTDEDIVKKIAGEVGLTAKVGAATTVHPYVLQDNTTNLEFLRERAAMLGYLLYVEGKVLHCAAHGGHSGTVTLTYNEDLSEFHPRMTTVDQINTATASGWDPKTAAAVMGKAQTANGVPKVGFQSPGGEIASQAFGFQSDVLVADRPIRSQAVADKLAQATLDRRAGRFIEAEGTAHGNPELVAGVLVDIKALGTRFSGKYFVTGATHTYGGDVGYVTRFMVSGFQPATLLSMLGAERDSLSAGRVGLVVGVVTDNKDPDGLCRVKVKFPWLSKDHASDWARLVTPGGGPQAGLEFIPEVNDEVLVGFEQGNINYPYVLGGLWNGKDAPPIKSSETTVIGGGKVKQRIIRSRTGHIITLDDSDNAPYIEIVDNTGKNKIKLDSKNNKLTVHLEGDMQFEAPKGDIMLKAKTVTVEASDALKMKGKSLDAEASQAANVKAGTDLKLKGMNTDISSDAAMKIKGGSTAEVKGSAKLTLDGGGMTEVKGGMVKVG